MAEDSYPQNLIVRAAQEVIVGRWDNGFQTGSGTQM